MSLIPRPFLLFSGQLTKANLIEKLFAEFDSFLKNNGYTAKKGQIVDTSIISAAKKRNSCDENRKIKQDKVPQDWKCAKKSHKDTDARWTMKGGKRYYDYKNYISVDVKNKFIRSFAITNASVHDSWDFDSQNNRSCERQSENRPKKFGLQHESI